MRIIELSIPVGHFAADITLTFEEDPKEINKAHRRYQEGQIDD